MNFKFESVALTELEIKSIREGGKIWQKIKEELLLEVREGATGKYINDRAKELFDKYRVEEAFFNYKDFPGYICVSVNECIIHGLGNDIPFKKQDKVTLDIGFKYENIYVDSAVTKIVDPDSNQEYQNFVNRCYKSLWSAIKVAKSIKESGKTLYSGDIASAIEGMVKSFNDNCCSIIDNYVGHTIGRQLHQKPHVFNKGVKRSEGEELKANTVICIEPMFLKQTTGEYKFAPNGYDIIAKDSGAFTCH